jgi:hypothetical protein
LLKATSAPVTVAQVTHVTGRRAEESEGGRGSSRSVARWVRGGGWCWCKVHRRRRRRRALGHVWLIRKYRRKVSVE